MPAMMVGERAMSCSRIRSTTPTVPTEMPPLPPLSATCMNPDTPPTDVAASHDE